jgi:hypothetical protein
MPLLVLPVLWLLISRGIVQAASGLCQHSASGLYTAPRQVNVWGWFLPRFLQSAPLRYSGTNMIHHGMDSQRKEEP